MYSELIDFKQAKVLVVGDAILDRYWHGPIHRISREAPVPIVTIQDTEDRLGGAANVAMNIISLNIPVKLISLAGHDRAAKALQTLLQNNKISHELVQLDNYATTDKLRILSRNQQLIRLDFEEDYTELDSSLLIPKLIDNINDYPVVIFSDYGRGTLNNIAEMLVVTNKLGIKAIIDPKGTDFQRYQGAYLLTPNLSEFEAVVGKCNSDAELEAKGLQLIEQLNLHALLITRSEKGMTLLRKGMPAYTLPTKAREVYDVTGAGDTVIALLAAGLAAGKSIEDACYLANLAAGLVVAKLGCATVSVTELESAIHGKRSNTFGILDENTLLTTITNAKQLGEKIVMTNGCFDILHPGHIAYLERARQLGDRLIVAVNTDSSVRKLKGPTRPINDVNARMTLLAALSCVDWVVPFGEDTPQRLIGKLLPDILVKGGDYRVEDIPGNQEVWANGGEVQVLNFEDGFSTTKIIEKIQVKQKNIEK